MNLVDQVRKEMEEDQASQAVLESSGFDWIGWIAWIGHILLAIFIVVVPFMNDPEWLKYHADIVFFLIVKWFVLNKCTLVKFEKILRGVSTEESLVYRFLEPLVELRHQKAYWVPIVLLGMLSFYRWRARSL